MKILFVDFDTLRPDHLGCYGYRRNTSPVIDSIAKEGVRFTEYYCSDAPCLPSRAALISGRFGIRNGIVGHGGTASDRRLTGYERGMHDQQQSVSSRWPVYLLNQHLPGTAFRLVVQRRNERDVQ